MGAFSFSPDLIPSRIRTRGFARVLAGLALIAMLGAAAGFAESDGLLSDQPVSTRPTKLATRSSEDVKPSDAHSPNDPPLTRAATQLRIDKMSPTAWLSQYGHVSIEHRE